MIIETKQATHFNYFVVFLLLLMLIFCYWYDQKNRVAFAGSYKVEFGHTQISVSKTDTSMLKTACINPWCRTS